MIGYSGRRRKSVGSSRRLSSGSVSGRPSLGANITPVNNKSRWTDSSAGKKGVEMLSGLNERLDTLGDLFSPSLSICNAPLSSAESETEKQLLEAIRLYENEDDDEESEFEEYDNQDFDAMAEQFFAFIDGKEDFDADSSSPPSRDDPSDKENASSTTQKSPRTYGVLTPRNNDKELPPTPKVSIGKASKQSSLKKGPLQPSSLAPLQSFSFDSLPSSQTSPTMMSETSHPCGVSQASVPLTAHTVESCEANSAPLQEIAFSFNSLPSCPMEVVPAGEAAADAEKPGESELLLEEKKEKSGMIPVKEDPFQWAYDVWQKRGLMGRKQRAQRKSVSPRIAKVIESIEQPQATPLLITDKQQPMEAGLDTTVAPTSAEKIEHQVESVSAQTEPIRRVPMETVLVHDKDGDDGSHASQDHSEFSNMLHLWQAKSDKRGNGHFLSPPNGSRSTFVRLNGEESAPSDTFHQNEHDVERKPFDSQDVTQCTCSNSIFSGNEELVDFFLPQLGMACTCGANNSNTTAILPNDSEPTKLEHFLRPWQVEFLHSYGIARGEELVKIHHRHAQTLARALRVWRHEHFASRTSLSQCGTALHIWSRTAKVHVRSVRKQLSMGQDVVEVPNVLEALSVFIESTPNVGCAKPRRRSERSRMAIEAESQQEI